MMHYWREYHNGRNTLEREAFRLDYECENHKQENSSRVEPWWIDPVQNVERYVIEKEFLNDIYANICKYAEPDLLRMIIDMRAEGWSDYNIARKAKTELPAFEDWGVREISLVIRSLTRSRNSALQKLYRDTKEYGNIDKYFEWRDATKN